MTPGARLSAAIEICLEIQDEGTATDRTVDAYFKKRRYAGSKDRRAISNRVYDVIRSQSRLDWWIERSGSNLTPSPRLRIIADLCLSDKMRPEEVQTLFSGATHCPDVMDEGETALAGALAGRPLTHHTDMPDWVAYEYPQWLDSRLRDAFGENFEAEIAAFNLPASPDIRVNMLKATFEGVQEMLQGAQINAAPTAYSPTALRITDNVRLGGTKVFSDGFIEVQDEGSQLISLLCDAGPGMTVIDFCAGAGGKTLAMAATMTRGTNNKGKTIKGQLIACDVFSQRLERMKSRLKRADANGIQMKTLSTEDDPWVAANADVADRVLLDVPCTGTGTWRREPDAKWRLHPEDMEKVINTQKRILTSASRLVKPGGRLIYATCSVLPDENEKQVEWFLSENPAFRTLDVPGVWASTIGDNCPVSSPWLRLSPASTQTDGFFCAVLERTS
ncbi:MAG: RsmB/NOP family class I SAM-dependent RNA methyltransferase [Rhodospirillales bacterium]|jgi:16S rRNA (cytosine967-C5)-methyltransferase|nr:RsmB/NOP family class I SAM-dependent RNA methyltransferase [Rhodospirillales bacterium]MBT4625543.1 RsmB/NOP family class I SAM-dependent RNA methyltransferase [Rhodospirillales bacterium]MBT5352605.1 RsmB/NOP family class I SAM-dependent RNA methyltransferase [Rhodospirillales bacterium]MBT5520227.1 RsmB/NOP family class I SAM-dependent RNA methyltransferase [Rhodospirillales bacterium]MBT6111118.1 RsmB/NOP family class I SAM-dependent RNA methyltransferase [Rhodospirillales bacterium]